MAAPVTVEQMLAARDARAERQRSLARDHAGRGVPCAVVSVTLVVPGPDKNPTWARAVFRAAMTAVAEAVPATSITHEERHDGPAGPQGYVVVAGEPLDVKRALVTAEDTHPWGRLFDLDVVADGVPLQRADVGAPPRRCLVCDGPAAPCARSRAHDLDALGAAIDEVLG